MRAFIASLLLIVSLLVTACGGGPAEAPPAAPQGEAPAAEGEDAPAEEATPMDTSDMPTPPEVFNADAASQYSGAQLTFYGDGVGIGNNMDRFVADHFTEATGIEIEVIPRPQDATETYSTYQRFFSAQSGEVDVMMVDVIWPGAFAPHLIDLNEALGEEAQQHYPTIVENNTIDGSLVAMPWFGDFGMLYYRTDLLEEYGFDGPPETWDELEEIAQTVQDGERENGNSTFAGFVWQGSAYEGLTCDALEWIYTHGGGSIIDDNGEITINNPQAIEALNRAAGWVGTISPDGVVSYREEEARIPFQAGDAMFMRNWPYAYVLGQSDESAVKDKFDVAPLPTANDGEAAGTVGGWQLGVSRYSEDQEAAIEFVRYLTSPEMQKWRATVGSFVPTIPEVAEDPEVLEAMPFLENLQDVVRAARPSGVLGERYNEGSTAFFQAVNQILLGSEAESVLPQVEQRLQRLVR